LKKHAFYILAVLVLINHNIYCQQYNFSNYSIDQGLAQSQVFAMIEDSRGFLWIGTEGGGVNRFDGITFINYTTKNGLSSNVIRTIIEDSRGNIWIGTKDNYVCRFDGKKFHCFSKKDGLENSNIISIAEDKSGKIWVGTNGGGLYFYDNQKFYKAKMTNNSSEFIITSLLVSSDGKLWIGTLNNGLFWYENFKYKNFNTDNGLNTNTINTIKEDGNNNLWIGTLAGISKFNGKKFTHYTIDDGICGDDIRAVLIDNKGNIWMGSYGSGASRLAPGKNGNFTYFNDRNGLCSNFITVIIQDSRDKIWFGSDVAGLCKFNGELFRHITKEDGLPHNLVMEIIIDSDNNYWFGTKGNGACKYDGSEFTYYNTKNGLCDDVIYCIFEDSKGNLWFGSKGNGVSKFDGKRFINYSTSDGLSSNMIYSITEDKHGNIWLVTHDMGINIFNGKSFTNILKEDGLSSNQLWTIFRDKDDNLWIGTDNAGVDMIPAEYGSPDIIKDKSIIKFNVVNVNKDSNLNTIMSITQDKEGNIWFGSFGNGLFKYNKKFLASYSVKDGLNSNQIFQTFADSKNNLWIGTEKGINKFNLNIKDKITIKSYGKSEGFTGIETNLNAITEDRDGNILIGTINGVTFYDPASDKPNLNEPKTHIANVRLFFEDVDWSEYCDSLTTWNLMPKAPLLPYNQNHLTFEFAGIDLNAPDKVRFQWILEGFDKKWSPVSSAKEITYSNIPAGQYTFKLIACNNDGICNKEPAAFSFEIRAPYWYKWWFIMIIILFFGFLLFILIKIRERRLEKEKRVLEEKVKIRTLELERKNEIVEAQKEEILDQSHELEKLSIVAKETGNAVLILDPEGNFLWINEGLTRMYKYTLEEMVGRNISEFSSKQDIKSILRTCIEEKKTIIYESIANSKEKFDKKRWAQTTMTPILDEDGNVIKIICIDSDISEIKEAEAKIQQQNEEIMAQRDQLELANKELEKLSIVASETDNAVVIMDANGNFEWLNEGLTRMYGYKMEDLLDANRRNIIDHSTNPDIKNILDKCIKEKKTMQYESLTQTKTGKKIWAQTTLTPILDQKGNIEKIVAIDTDISKIKEAESEIEQKNIQITDSISYAKLIQDAILPSERLMKKFIPDMFVFFSPKSIVSGDFYWFAVHNEIIFLATVDCTGHGVPGGFVSMIGNTLLNEIINEKKIFTPSEILENLNKGVITTLNQESEEGGPQDDGMDITVCRIDKTNNELQFACANQNVLLMHNGDIQSLEGDIFSIGGIFAKQTKLSFTNHTVKIEKGMSIYMFSDGYQDQFGGENMTKFLEDRFIKMLVKNHHFDMQKQREIVKSTFDNWKGDNKQVDDVLVIGFRL